MYFQIWHMFRSFDTDSRVSMRTLFPTWSENLAYSSPSNHRWFWLTHGSSKVVGWIKAFLLLSTLQRQREIDDVRTEVLLHAVQQHEEWKYHPEWCLRLLLEDCTGVCLVRASFREVADWTPTVHPRVQWYCSHMIQNVLKMTKTSILELTFLKDRSLEFTRWHTARSNISIRRLCHLHLTSRMNQVQILICQSVMLVPDLSPFARYSQSKCASPL